MASELGGLIEFIYITLSLIPLIYNQKYAQSKFIDKLYVFNENERASRGEKASGVEKFESVASNKITSEESSQLKT